MIKKSNLRIQVVRSSSPGLSSMSTKSCKGIVEVLSKHYKHVGVSTVNTRADLDVLVAMQPDLVFMGMKYLPNDPKLGTQDPDKLWIGDFLDSRGIAYTGSGGSAHELELDKSLSKQRVLDSGLQTSQYFTVRQNIAHGQTNLRYPLFVKPLDRGGGMGIDAQSVVYDDVQLQTKLQSLHDDLQADALVETYLPGREFSVAIIKNEFNDHYSAMPLELVAPVDEHGHRILSDAVKSADTEAFLPVETGVLKESIKRLALQVFKTLGAQDYGRIDIRLDGDGTPQFLEANLIPSLLNHYGNFPKACLLNMSLGFEPMLLQIVRLGLQRNNAAVVESLAFDIGSVAPLIQPQPL